jgi:hypothetical protein
VQNTIILESDSRESLFGPDIIKETERQVEIIREILRLLSHDKRVMLIPKGEK